MIKFCIFLTFCFIQSFSQPTDNTVKNIGAGEQPQISIDTKGTFRVIYGNAGKIYYVSSNDKGNSFSNPIVIAEVNEMHLGMTRGPQLASSKDYSVITAIDKKGSIHSFQLNHKTAQWTKIKNVNDIDASAPEGLMSITADDENNFYAVWLDLREDKNNKIAFSSLSKNGAWSKNKIVYRSLDKTVCECCKPSIAVRKNNVSIMFRNWISGSRDLHLISSSNKGSSFEEAKKLGEGTWKLKGCPMDGGGLFIDQKNNNHTVWQREGQVYYSKPGEPEIKIAEGRSCNISGGENLLLTWEEGSQLKAKTLNGKHYEVGEGTALKTVQVDGNVILAVWEKDEQILFKKL